MLSPALSNSAHSHLNRKGNSPLVIDLLSNSRPTLKWVPNFLLRKDRWKVLSGKWEPQPDKTLKYLADPKVKAGENISIWGCNKCCDFLLEVRFRFLAGTVKPPEGGLILYFVFRNIKNYYSFHFCLFKQKVQFVKRNRGKWSVAAERSYNFETRKEYTIRILSRAGFHQCHISGKNILTIREFDILKGRLGIGVKYCDAEFKHMSLTTF